MRAVTGVAVTTYFMYAVTATPVAVTTYMYIEFTTTKAECTLESG